MVSAGPDIVKVVPETTSDQTPIQFRSDMTVELVRSSAHDSDGLFAARVSTQGEKTLDAAASGAEATDRDRGLINYLMRDRHGSPFEHNSMTFYVPGAERRLVQIGKPGAYEFVEGTPEQTELAVAESKAAAQFAYDSYQRMLAAGIAREVARGVLPVSTYSSMYVTMNARSLMNFLSLRTKHPESHFPSFPQREIEMVAEQMESFWAELMPLTHAAFQAGGRVAP